MGISGSQIRFLALPGPIRPENGRMEERMNKTKLEKENFKTRSPKRNKAIGDLESQGWLEMKKIGQKPTKTDKNREKTENWGAFFIQRGASLKKGCIRFSSSRRIEW